MVGLDSLEQAQQTPVAEFFFPEDQDRVMGEFFPRVLRDGQGELDIRFRHFKTGAARWMAYKVLTLTDHTGAPTGFATVSQDVTKRKALTDELIEADRRKNEFLAMLAHELRNPLAPLNNAVQAIRSREPGDEKTVAIATDILERHIRQMSRLVNDLLDASRISRGKIELHRAPVALRPIIEQAIETMRPLLTTLEHTLTTTLPEEPLVVDGDAGRLSQVIGNLLSNAAKFTDKGGRITLALSRDTRLNFPFHWMVDDTALTDNHPSLGASTVPRHRERALGIDSDAIDRCRRATNLEVRPSTLRNGIEPGDSSAVSARCPTAESGLRWGFSSQTP